MAKFSEVRKLPSSTCNRMDWLINMLGSLDGIISTYAGIDVTLLEDDKLNVVIDKGTYNFRGSHPNNLLAIVGSKLVVEYNPVIGGVVPEASSFVVWSVITCVGVAITKRRHGR